MHVNMGPSGFRPSVFYFENCCKYSSLLYGSVKYAGYTGVVNMFQYQSRVLNQELSHPVILIHNG